MESNLIPVDTERCQGRKPGRILDREGKFSLTRCTNVPQYVAIQIKPGKDGEHGAISTCEECLRRLHEELPGFAFEVTIKEWNEQKLDEDSDRQKHLIQSRKEQQ